MKMVRVHGPDIVRVDEVEEPRIGPRDVLVEVANCGLCGSDLGYIAEGGVAAPAKEPFGLGHELAGTIVSVGEEVVDLAPGMRVIVNPMGDGNMIGNGAPAGGFAPLLRVPNATRGQSIHPIPDELDFELAALAEPLSVSLHAVRRSGAAAGDLVAVFGAGPIGLGIVLFLRRMGVERIAVVDTSEERLARAKRLGAEIAINASSVEPAEALGQGHGTADLWGWPTVGTQIFFEVTGAPSVLPAIVSMAPFHGRVVMVAVSHAPIAVDWKIALGKEMTITTSMAYPDEFPEVIAAISEPGFDADALISHRFPLDRFDDALAAARDRNRSAKVLVDCRV